MQSASWHATDLIFASCISKIFKEMDVEKNENNKHCGVTLSHQNFSYYRFSLCSQYFFLYKIIVCELWSKNTGEVWEKEQWQSLHLKDEWRTWRESWLSIHDPCRMCPPQANQTVHFKIHLYTIQWSNKVEYIPPTQFASRPQRVNHFAKKLVA